MAEKILKAIKERLVAKHSELGDRLTTALKTA
jgi:hypothetical protein